MNGIAGGYDIHMLDAANIGNLSWESVSCMSSLSGYGEMLTDGYKLEICATYVRMSDSSKDD